MPVSRLQSFLAGVSACRLLKDLHLFARARVTVVAAADETHLCVSRFQYVVGLLFLT